MDYYQIGLVYVFKLACILQMTPARHRMGPLAGPYVIVPKQIADCQNKGTNELRVVSSKLSKIGRSTYSYTSDVLLPHGLTDEITFGIECATHGNGGWKENAFNIHFGEICTTAKKLFPEIYESLSRELGCPRGCPISPGNYTIQNATYKPSSLKAFPTIFYDEYRTDIYFVMKGKRIGCKRFFFDVIPKKNA